MTDLIRVTTCDTCDHVEPTSRKGQSRNWLCLKHKRLPGAGGFVTGEVWEKDDPYLRCQAVNGGSCPLWTPARTPQMELISNG